VDFDRLFDEVLIMGKPRRRSRRELTLWIVLYAMFVAGILHFVVGYTRLASLLSR